MRSRKRWAVALALAAVAVWWLWPAPPRPETLALSPEGNGAARSETATATKMAVRLAALEAGEDPYTATWVVGRVASHKPPHAPIPNARVHLVQSHAPLDRAQSPAKTIGTDAEGVFRLPALGPGAYAVEFSAAGFAPLQRSLVRQAVLEDEDWGSFLLVPSTLVEGTVLAPDDTPVAEARVVVLSTQLLGDGLIELHLGRVLTETQSDSAGRFVLDPVPLLDDVSVAAEHPHFAPGFTAVDLSALPDLLRVRLQKGWRLEGVVTGENGPIEGASIVNPMAFSSRQTDLPLPRKAAARSDAEGRFAYVLGDGDSEIRIDAEGYQFQFVPAGPSKPFVEIHLKRAEDILLRVETNDGRPLADVAIEVGRAIGSFPLIVGKSDDRGELRTQGPPGLEVEAKLEHPLLGTTYSRFTLGPQHTLTYPRLVTVRLRVFDLHTRLPVPEFMVHIGVDRRTRESTTVRSDSGQYTRTRSSCAPCRLSVGDCGLVV